MWAGGLLDEVAALLPHGLAEATTAARAIGYAQALAELHGDLTARRRSSRPPAHPAYAATAARLVRALRRRRSGSTAPIPPLAGVVLAALEAAGTGPGSI